MNKPRPTNTAVTGLVNKVRRHLEQGPATKRQVSDAIGEPYKAVQHCMVYLRHNGELRDAGYGPPSHRGLPEKLWALGESDASDDPSIERRVVWRPAGTWERSIYAMLRPASLFDALIP